MNEFSQKNELGTEPTSPPAEETKNAGEPDIASLLPLLLQGQNNPAALLEIFAQSNPMLKQLAPFLSLVKFAPKQTPIPKPNKATPIYKDLDIQDISSYKKLE